MAWSIAPSFIAEISLKVYSRLESKLNARFQSAIQLYNACSNEAFIYIELMRKSE